MNKPHFKQLLLGSAALIAIGIGYLAVLDGSSTDIPVTKHSNLPLLAPYQVARRIRAFKKPKSMVQWDIFPSLMSHYGDFLAVPLCDIFNAITEMGIWPVVWKQEFVTIIPKKRCLSRSTI